MSSNHSRATSDAFRQLAIAILGVGLLTGPAGAQWHVDAMARATGVIVRAYPTPYGEGATTEGYITQPLLMVQLDRGSRLRFRGALDLESLTIPDGELSAGAWGEGYIDRRHPHTTIHELIVSTRDLLGSIDGEGSLGLVLGKGFAPFGSDDPMSRPFSGYPVNHHLAQILERAVGIAQYALGTVTIEGALFNGDEPERPGQWPLLVREGDWRFGDSWSGRLLWRPRAELELQASFAQVHSPENRVGAGGDQDKWSTSLRWQDSAKRYAMVEFASTSELDGEFDFQSKLAEFGIQVGGFGLAYRFEQTDRPEEERLTDPYHTRRPHLENSILGVFRWSLHTLRIERSIALGSARLDATPFIEATVGQIGMRDRGVVSPSDVYGTADVRHLRVGLKIGWNDSGHRMGRYGVLDMGNMADMGSGAHHH